VAARADHAHRRLRGRDERPAVGLPAGRRAHRGRHRDDGDQRGPHRSRVRPVRRVAAARGPGRPAGRRIRLPGRRRGRPRQPAAAPGRRRSRSPCRQHRSARRQHRGGPRSVTADRPVGS
jgi:hypothetical protein